ncbi:MAG: hypothetical protein ABIF17_02555 [Patescibacteria group bacterium]
MKKKISNNLIIVAVLATVVGIGGFFIYANSASDNNFLAFVKIRKDTSSVTKIKEKVANLENFEEQVDGMIVKGFKGSEINNCIKIKDDDVCPWKDEEEIEIYTLEIDRDETKKKDRAFAIALDILEDKKVRAAFSEYISTEDYDGFINGYLHKEEYKDIINGTFSKEDYLNSADPKKPKPENLALCSPYDLWGNPVGFCGYGWGNCTICLRFAEDMDLGVSPEDIVDSQIRSLEGILDLIDEIMDLVGGGYKIVFKLSPKQGVNN